jgi:RecJ-like exonuclease
MSEATYDITLHPAGPCKRCGGRGKIVLLTSSRRCELCCGSGKVGELSVYRYPADAAPKHLAGRGGDDDPSRRVRERDHGLRG